MWGSGVSLCAYRCMWVDVVCGAGDTYVIHMCGVNAAPDQTLLCTESTN